eukprot:3409348-Pyramimonas_sp.AAC.1
MRSAGTRGQAPPPVLVGAEGPATRGAACPLSGDGQRAVHVAAVIGKAPICDGAGGQQLRAGS